MKKRALANFLLCSFSCFFASQLLAQTAIDTVLMQGLDITLIKSEPKRGTYVVSIDNIGYLENLGESRSAQRFKIKQFMAEKDSLKAALEAALANFMASDEELSQLQVESLSGLCDSHYESLEWILAKGVTLFARREVNLIWLIDNPIEAEIIGNRLQIADLLNAGINCKSGENFLSALASIAVSAIKNTYNQDLRVWEQVIADDYAKQYPNAEVEQRFIAHTAGLRPLPSSFSNDMVRLLSGWL